MYYYKYLYGSHKIIAVMSYKFKNDKPTLLNLQWVLQVGIYQDREREN